LEELLSFDIDLFFFGLRLLTPLRPIISPLFLIILLQATSQKEGEKWGVLGGRSPPKTPTPRFIEKIHYRFDLFMARRAVKLSSLLIE